MNINEIAHLAGVSRATVSRYLNNGYVSQEKRERIKEVIDQTGYQPSSSAQTLRSRKTRCVGVIIPKIDSASIARVVKGISEILSTVDYRLLLACTNNDEKEELKYLRLFKENHVDGIILLGTILTPAHKKLIRQLSVPIVIVGQQLTGYTCVYHDDYGAAKGMAESLLPASHSFGYIGVTESDESVGKQRKQGVMDALSSAGLALSPDRFVLSDFSMQSGYKAAKQLFSQSPDVDTLLCATDTIAIGALQYLRERSLRVPEDVQIAGFGDSSMANVTVPTLTTVHFHYKTSGLEATKLLLDLIQNPDTSLHKELKLGFHIIENGSSRKA